MTEKKKKDVEKKDVVEIEKTQLDRLLDRIDSQGKDIAMLSKLVDQSRLQKYKNQDGEEIVRKVAIPSFGGKLILGWKLVSNISEVVDGRVISDQRMMLVFEDGKTQELTYLDFARKTKRVVAEVVSTSVETKDGKSKVNYKVKFDDGKELTVPSYILNK